MNNMDNLTINTLRFLAAEAIQKAKSGSSRSAPWRGTCGIYPVGKGAESKPCKPQLG